MSHQKIQNRVKLTQFQRVAATKKAAPAKLHRNDLTALERSKLVAEWVELVDEKPRQVDAVSKGGRGKEGGTRKAARDLGLSDADVRRSKKIANLSPEAQQAAVCNRSKNDC